MNKSILILAFIFLANNLFSQSDDINFNLPESVYFEFMFSAIVRGPLSSIPIFCTALKLLSHEKNKVTVKTVTMLNNICDLIIFI